MKICVLGAGKMGTWLTDALCLQHGVAVYDSNKERLSMYSIPKGLPLLRRSGICPELLINCVTLKYTTRLSRKYYLLPETCILADIASVNRLLSITKAQGAASFQLTRCLVRPSLTGRI